MPKKEKGKNVMSCSCGYSDKAAKTEIKEVVEQQDEIQVIEEGAQDDQLPITDAKCEKCSHDKARFWLVQTRAGDEPETRFFKCVECKHVWREY